MSVLYSLLAYVEHFKIQLLRRYTFHAMFRVHNSPFSFQNKLIRAVFILVVQGELYRPFLLMHP